MFLKISKPIKQPVKLCTFQLGRPTGEHGSYSFFRSFRYLSKGVWRHVQLGKFFFARVNKDSPVCVGELQLVWTGKQSHQALVSVRLYYLPEQTPEGRLTHHGQASLCISCVVLHCYYSNAFCYYFPLLLSAVTFFHTHYNSVYLFRGLCVTILWIELPFVDSLN